MIEEQNVGGRPLKYNDEIQALADEYLATFGEGGSVIPSNEGLAKRLNISRSTIYEWRDKFPRFSYTLEQIQCTQFELTLNKGLTGDFSATIAKLVLHNHGLHDKQDFNLPQPRSKDEEAMDYARAEFGVPQASRLLHLTNIGKMTIHDAVELIKSESKAQIWNTSRGK